MLCFLLVSNSVLSFQSTFKLAIDTCALSIISLLYYYQFVIYLFTYGEKFRFFFFFLSVPLILLAHERVRIMLNIFSLETGLIFLNIIKEKL